MQRPGPALIIILIAMLGSVVLSGVASSIALGRAKSARLGAYLSSALAADYSADPRDWRLAPLREEIIDAAREDSANFEERGRGDRELIPVYQSRRSTPSPTPEPAPTPSPAPAATRTPQPTASPTAIPTATPGPSDTPTAIATPTATSTPAPRPTPTLAPTPTPMPCGSGSSSFCADADSWVGVAQPDLNHGTETSMSVGSQERSLLRFELASIPSGSTVSHAELVLCFASMPPPAVGRVHELNRASSAWTEWGVDWINQPGGEDGQAITYVVPETIGCVSVAVTAHVQAWVGGATNGGWRITDQNEGTAERVEYSTREAPTPALRPRLKVTYTEPTRDLPRVGA